MSNIKDGKDTTLRRDWREIWGSAPKQNTDPRCARFVHLLPILVNKGRFVGAKQFTDGDLTVQCDTFAWERQSTDETGKGLPSFIAMYLHERYKEGIDPGTAKWIIDNVANDTTTGPVQLGQLLEAVVFATGIDTDSVPIISRNVEDTIARIKATGPLPDQKFKYSTGVLLRLFEVINADEAEYSGGDEGDVIDPYFARFNTLLLALHEIEQAISDHVSTRFHLDLDRDAGNLALSIRDKVLPQVAFEHREALALLPAHAVSTLCYQLARLIVVQPEGSRSFPKPRPLVATHIHYDYYRMYITQPPKQDAGYFLGTITLPKVEGPVYIRFAHKGFDVAIPKHKIKWAKLGYRTDPDRTLPIHQAYSLAIAFDRVASATVLQKRGRKPEPQRNVDIRRMYYHEGMSTKAIAEALQVTIRYVQQVIKASEQPNTNTAWPIRRRAHAPLPPDPEDIVT